MRASQLLSSCSPAERGWEWNYLQRQTGNRFAQTLPGAERPLFTTDGQRMYAIGTIGTPQDHKVLVWQLANGQLVHSLTHHARLGHIALSPNEKLVAVGDIAGELFVWDTATSEKLWSRKLHDGRIDG
ncbi:MAG: WD40 repeat domain-containing protein [Pirellulaceae bacterium]|nr:WD40 repeat domain-containing protein [Planctomycetales bacterium]